MRRSELEHIIRAAAAISNQYEIMVIGSQSILGSVAEPPAALVESMEADIYPMQRPELAELIEGAIGEGSPFHDLFGYYAQGVGPETAVLPTGWQARLVKIQNPNTDLKVGYCLDPHDLAISKLAAGREKDWPFVAEMIRHGFVDIDKLISLTDSTPLISRVKLNAWLQAQR
ncbi:MAG: hypothetical protein RLZ68_101 [Pseudomonadota bacterium]|jgi:hypothetical protein